MNDLNITTDETNFSVPKLRNHTIISVDVCAQFLYCLSKIFCSVNGIATRRRTAIIIKDLFSRIKKDSLEPPRVEINYDNDFEDIDEEDEEWVPPFYPVVKLNTDLNERFISVMFDPHHDGGDECLLLYKAGLFFTSINLKSSPDNLFRKILEIIANNCINLKEITTRDCNSEDDMLQSFQHSRVIKNRSLTTLRLEKCLIDSKLMNQISDQFKGLKTISIYTNLQRYNLQRSFVISTPKYVT